MIRVPIYIHYLFISCMLANLSCNPGKKPSDQRDAGIPTLDDHVYRIDDILTETSGLIHHGGRLWTINDSGGDPVLFALDEQNGKVLQAVYLVGARNRDWESLAQDEHFIYVCDIGNNYGRREVLSIYRVPKDSIPASGNTRVRPDVIEYTYAGREDNNPMRRSAYDCEAVFAYGDSLYLFTKDWETRSSTLYTCSSKPGRYELEPRRRYEVRGLVTGADMSPDTSCIILCGYLNYVPFVWIFEDFDPLDYSHGRAIRYDYPERLNMQTEGVAFPFPGRVYISCETTEYPAGLYRIDLEDSRDP